MISLGYNPQLSELDAGTSQSCFVEDALNLISLTVLLFSLPYLTFRQTPPVFTNLYRCRVQGLSWRAKSTLSSQIFLSQLCKKTSHTHQHVLGLMKAKFFLCRLSTSLFQVFCWIWTQVFARTPALQAPTALWPWKERFRKASGIVPASFWG